MRKKQVESNPYIYTLSKLFRYLATKNQFSIHNRVIFITATGAAASYVKGTASQKNEFQIISYRYVLLITLLLRGVGRWARKPVNHISWVAVVTPTDRPKSVRNCCLIELFCGVVCVATLPIWHFCWYRGFCQRTGSDLLLFVLMFTVAETLEV